MTRKKLDRRAKEAHDCGLQAGLKQVEPDALLTTDCQLIQLLNALVVHVVIGLI